MAASKKKQEADDAEFAAQFNAPDEAPKGQSEEEAFGLGPEDQGGGAGAAGEGGDAGADAGADAAAPGAGAAAEPQGGGGADTSDADQKRLSDLEAKLNARQAELDAREASLTTSNADDQQTGKDGGTDGGDAETAGGEDGKSDPRAALAEDFGPEFVTLLERFIKDVVSGSVSDKIGPLQSTVQDVIDTLQNERNANHFKAIADVHEDFMEIVESPAFTDWLNAQPDPDKADLQRVVASGSAKEIIAMLTKFKASKNAASDAGASADAGDAGGTDGADDQLDAAEGVRSSGLKLPSEPAESKDYAAAWNEA